MTATPGRGVCIHCLAEVEDRTWDHVFPRAWYPETTPSNVEKWKAPSCRSCNAAHGQNEQDLLLRLMMCFGPDDASAAGLPEKAIRSLDPREARDERDRRARIAKHAEIGVAISQASKASSPRVVIPNFGPGESGAGAKPITIPKDALRRLVEKIVRGFTYVHTERLITEDYVIESSLDQDDGGRMTMELIERYGNDFHRGPGIVIHHAMTGDDPVTAMFIIEIWNRLRLYAFVLPKGD